MTREVRAGATVRTEKEIPKNGNAVPSPVVEWPSMPNALRSQVSELMASLVEQILVAARSVPLEELWADPRGACHEPHRNRGGAASRLPAVNSSGEVRGGSTQATAKTLELVVLLLRGQRGGMRAEHLRKKLGVSKPEITRALKQGLETEKIVSKGERRATTYFAAAS